MNPQENVPGGSAGTRRAGEIWFRPLASGIAALSLYALCTPVLADAFRCPGGYRLKFIWGKLLLYPESYADIIFALGGYSLILACAYYSTRAIRFGMPATTFWAWLCVSACLLLRALPVDMYLVSRYLPPFHGDPWRFLAWSGGIASLASTACQLLVIVLVSRATRPNQANGCSA
jgi:hypothetical protein